MEQLLGHHWGSDGSSQWIDAPDHEGGDHVFGSLADRVLRNYLIRVIPAGNAEMPESAFEVVVTADTEELGISEAIANLDDIGADAREMGYEVPSAEVVAEAKRILLEMNAYRKSSYDAYAMSDGRVGVAVDGSYGNSMLLVCEPGGTALCVVTENLVSRHAEYETSSFLPDDFVRQALRKLASPETSGGSRR